MSYTGKQPTWDVSKMWFRFSQNFFLFLFLFKRQYHFLLHSDLETCFIPQLGQFST